MPEYSTRRARRNLFRIVTFTAPENEAISRRCQLLNAGFRRSHFYLAAALRALHAVAVHRGNQDGAYLIPAPHDTRRRGANGPIFSNHLSILFYRIEPQHCGKLGDVFTELGRQMTNQIRDHLGPGPSNHRYSRSAIL